jgi:hypothetical protein
MKYKIELTTLDDVKEFTQLVQRAVGDVRLSGKDEYGSSWELSAKSALCVFLLGGHIQHIIHNDQNIDWNTIVCDCDASVYPLIKKFVKE